MYLYNTVSLAAVFLSNYSIYNWVKTYSYISTTNRN